MISLSPPLPPISLSLPPHTLSHFIDFSLSLCVSPISLTHSLTVLAETRMQNSQRERGGGGERERERLVCILTGSHAKDSVIHQNYSLDLQVESLISCPCRSLGNCSIFSTNYRYVSTEIKSTGSIGRGSRNHRYFPGPNMRGNKNLICL